MHSFPEAVAEVSLKIGDSPGFPREATALCRGEHSAGVPLGKVPWHGTGAPQGWGAPGQVVAGERGVREGDPEMGARPGTVQDRVGSHPWPSTAGGGS